jgi:hypothetical protein
MKKFLIVFAALAMSVALFAQDLPKAGTFGITGSVGTSSSNIGAWYNVTDNIVLKPWVGFNTESNPDEYSYKYSTAAFNIGVDGLYELPIAGNFVLGVGPSIGYSYSSNKYEYSTSTTTYSWSNISLLAKASAQYFLSKNFAAFLDVGVGVEFDNGSTKLEPTGGSSTTSNYTITSFATSTAALGVAYLF